MEVPAFKPVVRVYAREDIGEYALVAAVVAEFVPQVFGHFVFVVVNAVQAFEKARDVVQVGGIEFLQEALVEALLDALEFPHGLDLALRGELGQRVHPVDVRNPVLFLEFLEIPEEFVASGLVRQHHDNRVVLREPCLREQAVRFALLVRNFGLLEVVEELHVVAAVEAGDKACRRYDGDKDFVRPVRKQLELVFALETERVYGKGLLALEQLQQGRGEQDAEPPVEQASDGTENTEFLDAGHRDQAKREEQARHDAGTCRGRRADAEDGAFDTELRTQVVVALDKVAVQHVRDDLARLAGQKECEQEREEVDSPVHDAGKAERVEDGQAGRQGGYEDELGLPVEVDDEQEEDEQCRHLSGELCLGEERPSGEDGVVHLARVEHLDILPVFHEFADLCNERPRRCQVG